jgi:hypothetical protein
VRADRELKKVKKTKFDAQKNLSLSTIHDPPTVKKSQSKEPFGKKYFRKTPAFLGENGHSRSRRLRKPSKTARLCFGKSRRRAKNAVKTGIFRRLPFSAAAKKVVGRVKL